MEYDLDTLDYLGSGGFGEVYGVNDRKAIKIIHVGRHEELRKATFKEIKVMLELKMLDQRSGYDHVLQIDGYHEDKRDIYIEMPRASCSMRQYIDLPDYEHSKMTLSDRVAISRQCYSGLSFLHNNKIVHNDIKPANLLFFDQTVKICDFGLSRIKSTDTTTMGVVPTAAGTLAYLAPEVHVEHRRAQYYSDVWSMGVTNVTWLTGKSAWNLPEDKTEHHRILLEKKRAQSMPDGLINVPERVRDLLEISLSYNPKARPTAAQMEEHLADMIGEQPTASAVDEPNIPAASEESVVLSGYDHSYGPGTSSASDRGNGHSSVSVQTLTQMFKKTDISETSSTPELSTRRQPKTRPQTKVTHEPAKDTAEGPSRESMTKHAPRLCHLKKWPDVSLYGIRRYIVKEKAGHYIIWVEPGSPAEVGGLKAGDRIVEVNGTNIEPLTVDEARGIMDADPIQMKLLVIDHEADQYFKDNNIPIRGYISGIHIITCPDTRPAHVLAVEMTVLWVVEKLSEILVYPHNWLTLLQLEGFLHHCDDYIQSNSKAICDLVAAKNMCPVLHDIIHYIHLYDTSSSLALDAACLLYGILTYLTAADTTGQGICNSLVKAKVPTIIAQHLQSLHPLHKDDELVNGVVLRALVTISNCSNKPHLVPELRQQVVPHLTAYLQETSTDIDRLILVIKIVHSLGATEYVTQQQWSGALFDRLDDLLSRMVVNEEEGDFITYYDTSNTGSHIMIVNLLECLDAMAQCPHNKCTIMNIVHLQEHQMELLIKRTRQNKYIIALLTTLSTHTCTRCIGGQWAATLLERYLAQE